MEYILPVGSIVTLNIMKEGAEQTKFIVMRRFIQSTSNDNEYFEYELMLYPSGTRDKKGILINHEQIEEVIFKGFSDELDSEYVKQVSNILEQSNEKKVEIL